MRQSIGSLLFAVGMMPTLAAYSAVQESRQGRITTFDITLDGVDFNPVNIGGKQFMSATIKGAPSLSAVRYEIGKPELPVLRLMVDGDVKVQVDSTLLKSSTPIDFPIKPSQASWSKGFKFPPPVSYDAASYDANKFNDDPVYTVEKTGSVRGATRHMVTINPMRYNPVTGTYQLLTHFKVTANRPAAKDEARPQTIAFVVGAKFAQSPALDTLVQSKLAQGFQVRKIFVGQDGVTTDTAIRSELKKIYSEGVNLRYAILIGDDQDVPSHRATNIKGVTDHFYRAIDTDNYDADINGPDIGVGRISVASEAQLAVVVGKISRYTDGRFAANQWMNHPAFVTTHDRYMVAEGTHNAVIAQHFAPRGYNRVFPDASEKGGDKLFPITLDATPAQIVAHMKSGRFIVNYSGHGSHTGWEDVTTADVNSLDDPNALPWVISNACITGDFRQEPVFAETWLRQPNGAVVFWGSMDSSYWDEDDILEKGMYDAVFTRGIRQFDLIHQAALGEVWRHYGGANRSAYYYETYVTFGDPSLQVRLGQSLDAEIEGPESLFVGNPSATWRVMSAGTPIPGTTITLRRESDGVAVSAITDENGDATISLVGFGASVEGLRMNVSGPDIKQVAREIAVVAPNQPHLGFSAWTTNGRSTNGVHVGETVRLASTVENFGTVATTGGQVRLVSVSGPASVSGASVAIAALGSRERQAINSGLSFNVSTAARRGDAIRAQFQWQTNEGQSGVFTLTWPLIRGDIEVQSVDYGREGVESIGTAGDIFVTIRNTGNEFIKSGTLTAEAGACTAEVSGSASLPEIAPGATIRVPASFHVQTNGQCESGSLGAIRLVGGYDNSVGRVALAADAKYLVGVLETEEERFEGMGLEIPDGHDQVVKTIQLNGSGPVKDIAVYVKIDHPYVGDLEVRLIAPNGKEVFLHNRTGGSADNLDVHYGQGGQEVRELDSLVGQDVRGDWKVSVKDVSSSDVGKFQNVELRIRHW
jgi:subtilisin-like proprotein convertase family protein